MLKCVKCVNLKQVGILQFSSAIAYIYFFIYQNKITFLGLENVLMETLAVDRKGYREREAQHCTTVPKKKGWGTAREMRNSPAVNQQSLPDFVLPQETATTNNCSLPHDSSQGLLAHTNIYLGKQKNTKTGQTSEQEDMTASWSLS